MRVGDRIGYVIPEWPGQTHIWIWREICHMREFGATVRLFATRRPPERDKARHAFAEEAAGQTTYLWPMSIAKVLGVVLWNLVRNPVGFLRCIALAMTLPLDGGHRFRRI